jgi:hypothetical protein
MNKQKNSNLTFVQFLLKVQYLAQEETRSDKGYAMMMTSIISIAMLSMLAAYMTMTNLSKSSTNAYVDSTNTFYAAESGMNKRANELRERFIDYATPTGTIPGSSTGAVSAANISNCFSISVNAAVSATNDFECRNYPFKYNNNIASVRTSNGEVVLNEKDRNDSTVDYIAHTFVSPKQNYTTTPPSVSVIPSGEAYAGLNAMEYKYTVYATATKPNKANATVPIFTAPEVAAKQRTVKIAGDDVLIASYDAKQAQADVTNNTNAANSSTTNTVLQMDFKSRIVPLFQFAAFYEGDLEMNSTSNMTLGGRVHTNANLYVQPSNNDPNISTTFLAPVTTVGSIYNRVDSSGTTNGSITRMLMTGNDCTITTNCINFPAFGASTTDLSRGATDPLSSLELNVFGNRVKNGAAGTTRLNTPQPGFLRKRNYYDSWTGNTTTTTNNSGEYYSKADMRLEMVPDRDVTDFTTAPWSRNQAIIPFNFTAINTVATETCTTTLPAKDSGIGAATLTIDSAVDTSTTGVPTLASDPAEDYINPDRNNASTLKCHKFTKGQLQSLRQPVLVLTDINQPNTALRTATGTTPAAGSEALILGRPTILPTAPGLSTAANNDATKTAILRALQVAIVSTPTPILFDELRQPVSASTTFKTTFTTLINTTHIPALTSLDRTNLLAATPEAIAALRNAWFLPAPIQRIENNQPQVQIAENSRNSGFYDGRERKWITMLQTNIASLSVWNRDGLYVEAIDNDRKTVYITNTTLQDTAFNSGTGTSPTATDKLAFNRASTIPANPKGLQTLGLGSIDSTEGGLVFHATVSDDLNGDGVMSAANDISLDVANPIRKMDAVGNLVDNNNLPLPTGGTPIIIDYPRKYRNGASYQSPFGFAFNGGDYLPAPMTLVTDQAIYIQGNFNNQAQVQPNSTATLTNLPSTDRLPASVVGDTITILSNQCVNTNPTSEATDGDDLPVRNNLGVPVGQLNCGLPRTVTGSSADFDIDYYDVTSPTAVNAAFLSYTKRSVGNLGNGRGFTTAGTSNQFSGGLNNYIRMLENWNQDKYFNYTGSMVSLGTPLEYSGNYIGGGTYYMIPVRNFNFDTNFNSFNLLPPLPPRAIYLQQDVFKRNYNNY